MNANASARCAACLETIDVRATRCAHCGQRQGNATLYRDVPGRALGGVAAALAQHFNWDVTVMRVLLVLSVAFSGGLVFWAYGVLWLMTPFTPNGRAPASKAVDWLGDLFTPRRDSGVETVRPE